jgi:hypothetical protein
MYNLRCTIENGVSKKEKSENRDLRSVIRKRSIMSIEKEELNVEI